MTDLRQVYAACRNFAFELGATGAFMPDECGQIVSGETFDVFTDHMVVIVKTYVWTEDPLQIIECETLHSSVEWIRNLLTGLRTRLQRWWDGEFCPALTPFIDVARQALETIEALPAPAAS